ncbi:alpha/beta fold hydrolase [Variovorax sp. KK3]|uniref:alpha/beta fold hydrolase n=1 Tax=Variovorax sp. KK3 TaxID=1855728 RepID=UPI00097C2B03|nr:alpha/beta hydrolase [Variovorax sp. KK3]
MTGFVNLRHARTAFDRQGAGLPILLIHGAEANRESLAGLASALAAPGPSVLCAVRYDQRECGETEGDGEPHTIPDLAQDAAELMTGLGFERFAVMGTSLGGRIAQALAIACPQRVETLCLVNTWPLDRQLADLNPEGVARMRRLRDGLPSTAAELAAMFYSPAHVARHPALAQRFARPAPGSRRGALAAEVHRLPPALIQARTLCVSGGQDRVVPTEVVRALADRIPRAQFACIEDVGHSIAVQAPEALAARIANFTHSPDAS